MKFSDINILSIGNTIQIAGALFSGEGKILLCFLPGEKADLPFESLEMSADDWKVFLRQSDLLEVEMLAKAKDGTVAKAIIRKSQRQIDQVATWNVFRRDRYSCRYCGKNDVPLTVDHVVTWESGGPTIEENLVSACRKCNKVRGDLPFPEWLQHPYYLNGAQDLHHEVMAENEALLETLDKIPRVVHVRSR